MTDLWDPIVRVRTCVSCHVGNVEQGKVLTHAMYAAGHPPLPGIEASTFAAAMPNHWKPLSQKRKDPKPRLAKYLRDCCNKHRYNSLSQS